MKKFPDGFTWGAATSAYQIEGAHDKDGKGPSIWDAFCTVPNRIHQNDDGITAIDHYHKFKEDVALMKSLGFKAYRFSIAWPRVMPEGKGAVNEKGIEFYNKLIDELLANDIEPWVTLYHWDLPLALQMEEDGWTNPKIIEYFKDYADLCFERFGDRVKHWSTFNEPWVITVLGYGLGAFAPGRKSEAEAYLAAHHILLSHAHAVQLYRSQYTHQNGIIGITNNSDWREPLTDKPEDIEAAERSLQFFLGWFADPIYLGDYPAVMRERLGNLLPEFSAAEKELLKGSSDFFGLNHYTTMLASHQLTKPAEVDLASNSGLSGQDVKLQKDPNWPLTAMGWGVVPWGIGKLLHWIDERYGRPNIYITENGFAYEDQIEDGKVNDQRRIDGYQGYLSACHHAVEAGVQLKGYFAWSLFDNFEWTSGYRPRFGITYVDYETLARTPKASALWFRELMKDNALK
jgi:beta-galactosidase